MYKNKIYNNYKIAAKENKDASFLILYKFGSFNKIFNVKKIKLIQYKDSMYFKIITIRVFLFAKNA